MTSAERTVSFWEASSRSEARPPLQGTQDADVCVVGAGIAGLTTAYQLALEGQRVIVLDAHGIGAGETGQTTAHLASANDDYFHVIEKVHGQAQARLVYQSHHAAIEEVGRIAERERIECNYERVDGYWFQAPDAPSDLLQREFEAARRVGADVTLLDAAPGVVRHHGQALRFAGQGQIHPLKYLAGLAAAIERFGGRIHGGTHVTSIEGGERPRATGHGFEVRARSIAVCTNSPIVDRFAIHTKQGPYRTFAIAARVPRGALPHVLLWDTHDPYHYVRLTSIDGDPENELLVVGGEDHKTGHENDASLRFAALEQWARQHFPRVGDVEHRWSGQVMEPVDHLAFIGQDPEGGERIYVATGDSGQGMTHGTIAGMLLRDLILGRPNAWSELYSPARRTLATDAVKEWISENIDVAKQYVDLVPGVHTTAADPSEIARGHGAIVQRGARKIAVYRSESGEVVERSAFCTHLGCVVRWNSLERSWDCPCHGSRFAPDGTVLNGPAIAPLSPADTSE